jgi:hypothetical protein
MFQGVETIIRRVLLCSFFILGVCLAAPGQQIVDKTVATISDGSRTELLTLSDLNALGSQMATGAAAECSDQPAIVGGP